MFSRPIKTEEIAAYGSLLGRLFAAEGWNATMVKVLDDPLSQESFLRDEHIVWVEAYAELAYAYVVEELRGLILFDVGEQMTQQKFNAVEDQAFEAGLKNLSVIERKAMTIRRKEMEGFFPSESWMSKLFPDGFGHIGAICVSPEHRGSGVFRALFEPVISKCNGLQLPLCLEAFSEHLLDVYGSRGFELVRTVVVETLPLTEYCMVRQPDTGSSDTKSPSASRSRHQ